MINRRRFLIGSSAAAAGLIIAKPQTNAGGHSQYFAQLNTLLRQQGIDKPSLLIDLDRLDRNVDRVMDSVNTATQSNYRIVVKSVPAPGLVDYIASRSGSNSAMVFHRPFIEAIARLRPQSDILLGKPLPVASLNRFYDTPQTQFDPARQLQWLVDTPQRLNQYLELAKARGLNLRVNLEIDVGLHRGGFTGPDALRPVLTTIAANPNHLTFSGFMGYDAHVSALPSILANIEIRRVKARYADCIALLNSQFPQLARAPLTFNGAGSPTFRNYQNDTLLNDISVGSALLKPSHYDLPLLTDFEPCAYIASPLLKRHPSTGLPSLEWLSAPMTLWNANQADTLFIYGGNWLAEPVSPPGVTPATIYQSSNQEGYYAAKGVELAVGDFLFQRPSQSEAVLLQFGELLGIRGDRIEQRWPTLPPESPYIA
ncbi:alanine racemase [Amphritea pacifica]|uniref:Alanine racemase n=1 Tax=Amphritea pacifica TaxID=2811233 RepID=A0ABS2W7S0_9GAMM|nr:alanine racemase [Amphritea pacifica]MBN0987636.1 alanine racemase [Amphritea pacifica]MBN1009050.1 alanine racemase [Amphritea pacifica]